MPQSHHAPRHPFIRPGAAALALLAVLAVCSAAPAGPPPGERWSDMAWGKGKIGTSAFDARPRSSSPTRSLAAPSHRLLRATPARPSGQWVCGPDGVYRWYPAAPVVRSAP